LRKRAILPTGNCKPALCDLDTAFFPELFPLPDIAIPTKSQTTSQEKRNTQKKKKIKAHSQEKNIKIHEH
jgi:hypothetical protein